MPCITKCCCCGLRSGAIASSLYSMIYASIALGFSSFQIHRTLVAAGSFTKQDDAFFIAMCVDAAFSSLLFLLSIVLLYGVKYKKRFLLLPYVVCMTILVVLQCTLMLLLIMSIVSGQYLLFGALIELSIVALLTFTNIYCILCVISHYQDLRDGLGSMRAMYRAQGGRLPPTCAEVVAEEEKHGDLNNLENANFVPQYPGPPVAMAGPYPVATAAVAAPPPYQPIDYPYQPPEYPAQIYPSATVPLV